MRITSRKEEKLIDDLVRAAKGDVDVVWAAFSQEPAQGKEMLDLVDVVRYIRESNEKKRQPPAHNGGLNGPT